MWLVNFFFSIFITQQCNYEFARAFSNLSLKSHFSFTTTLSIHTSSCCKSYRSDDVDDGELLLSWAHDHEEGFVGPLKIGQFNIGHCCGLFASESVNAGDSLCEKPNENCLSIEQAWEDDDLLSLDINDETGLQCYRQKCLRNIHHKKKLLVFMFTRINLEGRSQTTFLMVERRRCY